MVRAGFLFNDIDWFSVEEQRKEAIQSEIDGIDGNRLLNTSVDDLCAYFEEKYTIDVPVLHENQIVADQREIQIDVSQDTMRYIHDRSRSFYVPGTRIEITVPFKGDAEAFKIRPTRYTLSPPRAEVSTGALILSVDGTNLEAKQVRSEIDRMLTEVNEYLGWLRENADGFNRQIRQLARERIEQRHRKLLADQNLVASLGYPLKERPDAPKTFIAPEVRKRIAPMMPSASSAPYHPEPTLSADDYEHILSVMTNMALVMERSPSAFVTMDEEALRSHFLVQLNGHYEGQATGETFNYEGKTDILVRVNGKNIFIAECKYWAGPKNLLDTIDQLLGYMSWRDTKAAVVVFNRNKNFSRVLKTIPNVVKRHSNFKRELDAGTEGRFRYVLAHRDDSNREMIVTILAFDVPRKGRSRPE